MLGQKKTKQDIVQRAMEDRTKWRQACHGFTRGAPTTSQVSGQINRSEFAPEQANYVEELKSTWFCLKNDLKAFFG